jgi:hypothetical protein
VNLSVDGKHSVSVQSDDPAAVTEGLLWAKKTWGQLLRLPGKPLQAQSQQADPQPDAVTNPDVGGQAPEPDTTDLQPPVCRVHHLPMVRVQGRKGPFWSCHEKQSDGGWCTYRPPAR